MTARLFCLCLFLLANSAQAEVWRFALIGDVPYTERERRELPHLIETLGRENLEFVVHVGDIKNGRSRCDDTLYIDRRDLFNTSAVPLVFAPGDNEWSDCDRASQGGYDPQERLNRLRQIFWKDEYSLGRRKLRLERQNGNYPEHARFRVGPVLFVTLNIPSGNNYGMLETPSAEFLARNPAVIAWLREGFAVARRDKLAGVVFMFQADPAFQHFSRGMGHPGFTDLLSVLREETLGFPGQVVVLHGDTHFSRIDHPLNDRRGQPLANFTRVESHGYPTMGWTLGIIDTSRPELFRFEPHVWP